ncbi:hypothetical protein MNBD_DELTA01-1103 [hydrothermal vent metagenome]|uniref:Uracil-DNA glycosylase-like domain-containing protein n=1 Tax=hydrothermal vent metagenome TaxID=652676 RepID=A0A3B0RLS8_9ZZZZ
MDELESTLEETVEKLKDLQAMGLQYISVAPPAVAGPSEAFSALNKNIESCTKCVRHSGQVKAALGIGPEDARVVFVSAPAMSNAAARRSSNGSISQTENFSKAETELLDNIIKAMGLTMDEVYFTCLVRCAGEDAPGSDEIEGCLPFLKDELDIINPVAIVAMGGAAAHLIASDVDFANLRGIMRSFDDIPLMITHHPSELIKAPGLKRAAWEDIKKVMALL